MVIRRSSAGAIDTLLAGLDSDDDVDREAAIARLAVIGTRAVSGLLDVLRRAPSSRTRVAALQALEPARDPRALDAALACLEDADTAVAVQAIQVVRRHLASAEEPRAIDRLAAIAVDRAQAQPLRLAALDALADMGSRTVEPVWQRLEDDTDPQVRHRARAELGLDAPAADSGDLLEAAASGTLPSDPRALLAAVSASGATAPLPMLHRVIEVLRAREESAGTRARDLAWYGVRAALHQALAARGSTVALYDLRETIGRAAEALPLEFAAALAAIGDRTCLDAIGEAYTAAPHAATADDWWRGALARAFHDIMRREKLTERHAAVKRVRSKWPVAARALLGPPKRSRR